MEPVQTPLTEKVEQVLDKLDSISSEIESFFKHVPDLCCVFSATEQFIRVSHSVNYILGYTEEEFCRRDFKELIHPDDLEKTKIAIADLAVEGTPIVLSNRYLHKDGTYRTLAWNSSRLDENGKAYGIARDITNIPKEIKENA